MGCVENRKVESLEATLMQFGEKLTKIWPNQGVARWSGVWGGFLHRDNDTLILIEVMDSKWVKISELKYHFSYTQLGERK